MIISSPKPLPFLLVSLFWFIALTCAVLLRRLTLTTAVDNFWSDTFFIYAMAVVVMGLVIHLAHTSRHHYYKHLLQKVKSAPSSSQTFETEEYKRAQFSETGKKIALGGLAGVLVSALLLL